MLDSFLTSGLIKGPLWPCRHARTHDSVPLATLNVDDIEDSFAVTVHPGMAGIAGRVTYGAGSKRDGAGLPRLAASHAAVR